MAHNDKSLCHIQPLAFPPGMAHTISFGGSVSAGGSLEAIDRIRREIESMGLADSGSGAADALFMGGEV